MKGAAWDGKKQPVPNGCPNILPINHVQEDIIGHLLFIPFRQSERTSRTKVYRQTVGFRTSRTHQLVITGGIPFLLSLLSGLLSLLFDRLDVFCLS